MVPCHPPCEVRGWVMPASQILEKLPFPAQMKGKGAVLWERGLLLGGQMDPFFLQLVAIIHFIISMMKFVKSLPNSSTNAYVLISIIKKKQAL